MKLNKWLKNGTTATLVMASALAAAQTELPAAQDDPQDEPEVKEPLVRWNELVFGFNSAPTNVHFERYGRVPEGFTLQGLKLFSPGNENFPFWAKFIYRGSFMQDNYMSGRLVVNRGHTIISGSRTHSGSYVFGWEPKGMSETDALRLALDHSFAPGIGGFLTYESRKTSNKYAPPRAVDNTYTEVAGAGIGAKVLDGNLDLSVASRRISDLKSGMPASRQQKADVSYGRDFGSSLSLEGSYGYARTEQAMGLAASDTKQYALAGSLYLSPDTGLHFHFGRQDYDFENVANAKIRKRLTTSARLVHRFAPGTSLQLGFKHKETERFRKDQAFVDVPKSNEYDARFSTKIANARVTLKGSWEDLTASAAMQTLDTRQMLWDDKALFQARVATGSDKVSAYGVYTYRFNQNRQRSVDIRHNNFVVGGSYVFSPYMDCYLELASDSFLVKGPNDLGFWFPNARSATFGLNWSPDISLYTSASLNVYENGDIRGHQLTFNLRKVLSESREFELVVAPWRQVDRQFDISGYNATILSARYMVKF